MSSALLQQTPEAAVAQISIALLDEARVALNHLVAGTNPEALHDFRVAIRRLRSTASAWRDALRGRLKRKDRDALRALQHQTGGARDAEVALAWLDGLPEPEPDHVAGYDALREYLTARMGAGEAGGWSAIVEAFNTVDARLRRRLATSPDHGGAYASALAASIRTHYERLFEPLRRASIDEIPDDAHDSRIRCKRLRYLIEPITTVNVTARGVVKSCKRIQTILGELNDADVQSGEIERAMASQKSKARPGLEAVLARAHHRRSSCFADLREWLALHDADFAAQVTGLIQELELTTGTAEIERTYLLRGLPQVPEVTLVREIRQGYLPTSADDTEERVREIQEGDAVQYVRTVKRGRGLARREMEEVIDRERFEALWPKTSGRRVHKRRHVVPVGAVTWEIDQFLDRDLFLAEVELAATDDAIEMPDWLAPLIEREVTDDRAYANSRLAC